MPEIHSANPDFQMLYGPGPQDYMHGAARRKRLMPMAFQVTSPFDNRRALLPHALVLHVNPQNLQITHNKIVERIQTRGGWVEQHWGDQLDELHCEGSTGSFMNIHTGLTSVLRQRTIAWDRFRDLHDLYRNNGSVYDPSGSIVLQGNIMLMYDQGVYIGTFRTFEFEETAETPFAFRLSWAFKVEYIIWQVPGAGLGTPVWGPDARVPGFQGQNSLEAPNAVAQQATLTTPQSQTAAQELGQQLGSAVVRAGESAYNTAADVAAQLLFGSTREELAAQQAQVARDRQEQMRQAVGAPTSDQARQQQRQELGVPSSPSIPTTNRPPRGDVGR